MSHGNALLPLRPMSIRSLVIWATAALLLGCTFALAGLASIYVAIAFAAVVCICGSCRKVSCARDGGRNLVSRFVSF